MTRWHTEPRNCRHFNDDVCPTCDFDGYYAANYADCPWRPADEPTPPTCDWCGEEYATELRNLGHTQQRPRGPWRPTLADLCTPCAHEADNERETSIHD